MPTAIPAKRQVRSIILGGIAATLLAAVENDRDQAWIVADDAQAASKGSFFSKYGGWMQFIVGAWKPYTLSLRTTDKGVVPVPYNGLSIACRVRERLNTDLSHFDPNIGNGLTLTTPDAGIGDGGIVLEHIILP